ncbi:MAG: phosphotransferase, partial [Planctomycetota bacterium]
MTLPWHSDRKLGADTVARLVAEQFGLTDPARYLSEGWDSEVFLVGDIVFRFPKRAEIVTDLELEKELLPRLRLPVAVPRFEYLGRPSADFPYPFVGYRIIEGETADRVAATPLLVEQLGEFVRALHAHDPSGVRPSIHRSPERMVARIRERLHLVPPALRERADAFLAASLPAAYEGPPRLTHSDLLPQHLVLRDGRIA